MRRWTALVWVAVSVLCASCGGGLSSPGDASAAPSAPQAAEVAPQAANVLDAAALFDWAPTQYSQHFKGAYKAGVYERYNYRYFAETGNYLAVADGSVFILGPVSGGVIQNVGLLSSFECRVFPSNCASATPPASSMAGMYLGDSRGSSPNSILLVDGEGTFMGYNVDSVGSEMDVLYGKATLQNGVWSSNGTAFGHCTAVKGFLVCVATTAKVSGSHISGSYLSGNVVVASGSVVGTRLGLNYYAQSNTPASLATVGGTYNTPSAGQSIAINAADGSLSGALGPSCSMTGTVSVKEPTRNVYTLTTTLSGTGCPGTGVFQALGYYYTANNGAQSLVVFGVNAVPGQNLQFVMLNMPRRG